LSYLLDTNVISELRRKKPNPGLVQWLSQRPPALLFLSVLTLGELRKGIESCQDAARKSKLRDWLEFELPSFFAGRIINIDVHICDTWGRMIVRAGKPLPVVDSLLGATAIQHGLSLVTRNTRDFEYLDIDVINPWELN
jgi:toxin FitB